MFAIRNTLRLGVIAALLASQPGWAVVPNGKTVAAAPTEMVTQLIVKYNKPFVIKSPVGVMQVMSTAEAARLSALAGTAITPFRVMSGDAQVVKLIGKMPVAQAEVIAKALMQDPAIQYAEPDRIAMPQLVTNDPQYVNQWDMKMPVAGNLGAANVEAAWNRTTGVAANSVVAVIDTGYLNHADLAGRILPGFDFITDHVMANDGNGRDASALDPGDWTPPPGGSNSSWHGTHVAGTIVAVSNNALGVAGINWNARILPVRVLGRGGGVFSDIVDGIRWAAGVAVPGVPINANPAKVLNMSLGGAGACPFSLQSAIVDAIGNGATVVVAAGNSNLDSSGFTPANCAGVISVASNDKTGSKAWYSNFGSLVALAAPGGDTRVAGGGILSTLDGGTTTPLNDNTYAYYQGTSMAAPHVAGVVSLMTSVAPTLNPTTIKRLLQGSARPFPAGSTCTTALFGAGILNAQVAVMAAQGLPLVKSAGNAAFGSVPVGTTGRRVMTLTNAGLGPVTVSAITAPAGITVTGCAAGTVLNPQAACAITATWTPAAAGTITGVIAPTFTVAPINPMLFLVSGTAVNLANEVWPPAGVMPAGWVQSAGSNAPWAVAIGAGMAEGQASLKAGTITHGQNSSVQVTKVAAAAGNATFSLKVGSETNFDFLRFYIDGVLQGSWSGAVAWTPVTFPVAAGAHTYKWTYVKDLSVTVAPDTAWIDLVVLP